jgi:transketolase
MTQIKPLQVKNFLAHPAQTQPTFFQKVTLEKNDDENFLNLFQEIVCSDPKAIRALVALMDMNAVLGGAACHYGGPAALADLWSAAHAIMFNEAVYKNKKWHELYHFVNDAGHCENALYAIKANYNLAGVTFESLKKFRSIDSNLTGHGESHLFPEGVYLSNGPLGSALPQSQGLAIAEKLSGDQRTVICTLSDGAAMEGEAKEALAAIPGLAEKGFLSPYVLMISDNNTKLSGRIDSDSFSMKKTFESLSSLGWNVIRLEEGNNLLQCVHTLRHAIIAARQNPQQPVAIWAKTTKGIGSVKAAASASGAHGFPCKNVSELKSFVQEIYQQPLPALMNQWIVELENKENEMKANATVDTGEKIQKGIAKALLSAVKKGRPIISVTSDLPGSTGLADFRKEFPHHSLDVGVAESNMISTAAGLSKQGYIPVVDTFAQFGVTKGALPLTMSSLSQAPMIAVFSHTGFQDAADGASHQALSYMAMLATIPQVDLYSLSTSEDAEKTLEQVIETFVSARQSGRVPTTSVLFLGRENFPKTYSTEKNRINYQLHEPQLIRSHKVGAKNVLLLTTGSLVGEAIKASEVLEKKSIGSLVVSVNSMNNLNFSTLIKYLNQCENRIVTVEDHQVLLGLGSYICHQLSLAGEALAIESLGVKAQFGQSAYSALELYQKHGLDAKSIVVAAEKLLK